MKCPLSSTTGPNISNSPKATSIETVRVVPGTDVPRVREADPAPIPRLSSEGPARLIPHPSADDHHETAVKAMLDQTRLALDALSLPKRGAMAWAYAINYHADVRQELYEAAARIQHALDLIDIHENG